MDALADRSTILAQITKMLRKLKQVDDLIRLY